MNIAPSLDKKNYVQSIAGNNVPESSPDFSADLAATNHKELEHDFKFRFIRGHIKETKVQLKKSRNSRSLLEAGELYLLQNNYRKALKLFTEALEVSPDFLPAQQKLVETYLRQRKFPEVEREFQVLLEKSNRDESVLLNFAIYKAFLNSNEQNVSEAMNVLDEVLEKNPKNIEAENLLGMIVLNIKQDPTKAKIYFEKALKINPDYIHALNNYAVCVLREGSLKEAEKLFKDVVRREPKYYPQGYQNLCASLIEQKKFVDALSIIEAAKKEGVVLEPVWEHKEGWLLMQLDRVPEALKWYQNKVRQEPQNDLLFNNLGVCYRTVGQLDLAEQCFTKAVALFSKRTRKARIILFDHFKSLYNLGRVYIDHRDLKRLTQISNQILDMNPEDAYGLYLKGSRFTIEEEYMEAKKYYERALKINPDIAEAYSDYSFVLEEIEKDYPNAIKVLETAVSKGFESIPVLNNLAVAYIKSDRFDDAKSTLRKFNKQKDLPYIVLATKGLLEFRTGNFDKGNDLYSQALADLEDKRIKRLVPILKQIWAYEKARFYFKHDQHEKAVEALEEAQGYPPSYLNRDIESLSKELQAAV